MVPGNHDYFSLNSANNWDDFIGKTYLSFDYNQTHFILLNTEEGSRIGKTGFGESQLTFIQQDLARLNQKIPIFIFLHQPVWLYDNQLKQDWKKIEKWVGDRPMTVIAGHFHILAETKKPNRRYLIVGPSGGRMRMGYNPELGLMHHITKIQMIDNKFSISFLESSRSHSEDLALKAYKRYLKSLLMLKGSAEIHAEMK